MYDPDLWWHLAQGREAAGGHLVRTNLFSFVYPDYPQPYTSWLFDLGTYLLWTRGGAAAVQAAQAFLIAATLGPEYCLRGMGPVPSPLARPRAAGATVQRAR